jgi:hypothetical protein
VTFRPRIYLVLAATLALAAVAPAVAFAAGGTTSAAPSPAVAGGWGKTSSYIGKYQLVPSGTASTTTAVASPAAGVFSLAVRTAAQLRAASGPVSSGALKTFLRKVKTGEPLAPSGILSIFGSDGSQVLYLTELNLHGTQRTAVVNGGSFLGVPIGTLSATPGPSGSLDTVIKAGGLGTVHVRLVRFVAAPPSA